MTLVYAKETLATAQKEIDALGPRHWDEVAHDKDIRVLDVDWATFLAAEKAGSLFILTARLDGVMVGYMLAFLRQHLHSRSTKTAYVDLIYLVPEQRIGRAGTRFLKYADTALAALADFIYWHVKPEADFSPILKRSMGYHSVESIWGRSTNKARG